MNEFVDQSGRFVIGFDGCMSPARASELNGC